eukprot:6071993-Pyramimonas_sp.AAC.1
MSKLRRLISKQAIIAHQETHGPQQDLMYLIKEIEGLHAYGTFFSCGIKGGCVIIFHPRFASLFSHVQHRVLRRGR